MLIQQTGRCATVQILLGQLGYLLSFVLLARETQAEVSHSSHCIKFLSNSARADLQSNPVNLTLPNEDNPAKQGKSDKQ